MFDRIDKKLLYELNWNCRQTNTQLGKKLRVSKQVIAYRISQLEKEKILLAYNALVDWRRLGYNSSRIYIKWKNINPEKEKQIYEEIKKDTLFTWCVKFQGEFDIGLYVWISSVPDFSRKWFEFLSKNKQHILKYEYYESVNMIFYPLKPLAERPEFNKVIIGNHEKENFDTKDFNILEILAENAKTPMVEIAKKVKLTPKAVIYRIKNLEKKEILLGYNALIDTDKLGYSFYKVDFYLNDLSKIKEMFNFAKFHKNIVYVMRTIGGPEYEIEVMVKDVAQLTQVISEIRQKFFKEIEHYRIHRFEYTLKQTYLPGREHSQLEN